jgi:hypothetical protein
LVGEQATSLTYPSGLHISSSSSSRFSPHNKDAPRIMPAIVKIYTDSAHTTEVAHTAQNSTTLNGALSIGATSATLTSAAGMPTSGYIDIDTAGNLETIGYYGLSGNVIQLSKATTIAHANGVAAVQWYYQLAVGDQTNGIVNDGTQNTPTAQNTATWYAYNAGDQTAQSTTLATVSGAPSTTQGFADTLISITSATAGFAASVAPGNIAAGAASTQFWVAEEVPSGQSAAGNPQICQITISFTTV